jgi:hypothetical protein
MINRSRIFLAALAAVAGLLACGDSDDTPLGSEFIADGLLGSKPGVVFDDSIDVSGDTVYTYFPLIDKRSYLETGIQNGYQRTTLVKADFSTAGDDTNKTVFRATLRINIINFAEYETQLQARFLELGTEYNEGDSVAVLDTTTVIPDPDTGAQERDLAFGTPSYELPNALVEAWIKGDSIHNGIAVVYSDAGDKLMGFDSRESAEDPSINVDFVDGTKTDYKVTDDGFYTRPLSSTSELVISDGFVRRIYFQVDLSQVDDSAAVHNARVVFNFVPNSVFGANQKVFLYVPNSSDPDDPGFLVGTGVISRTLDPASGVLELPLTNVLLLILSGEVPDNGFVLRWDSENIEVRQAEFYTSAHGSLKPKVYLTYSTPADFEE